MPTNVILKPETALTITCSRGDLALVRRLSTGDARDNSFNSPLSNVNLNYGCSLKIGPFVTERYYQIVENGSPSYFVVPESVTYNHNSTGIYSGGALSINADPTKFDIAAGSGIIVDNYTDIENPTSIKITWPAVSGISATYIGGTFTSYVAIDAGGNVVQFAGTVDADNRRDYILLGLLVHTSNTVVESVSSFVSPGYDHGNSLTDLSAAIGVINLSGNIFSAASTNLTLAKSVGVSYKLGGNLQNSAKSPNEIDVGALTAPPIFKPYRDGLGGFKIDFPLTTSIDPTKWDNGTGTLATVTPDDPWQVMRIYLDPVNDNVIVHYGQAVYKSKLDAEYAIGGEIFSPNPVLVDTSLRAFLIIKYDCVNLANTLKCKFIAADKFGITKGAGAVSNAPTLQDVYSATSSAGDIITLVDGAVTYQDNNNNPNAVMIGIHAYESSDDIFQLTANGTLNKAKITSDTTANRPGSPLIGQLYFDTSLGKPIWYDGANWVDATGGTV